VVVADRKGDEVYLKKAVEDESVLPLSLTRPGEETPRMISSASSDRSHPDGAW
jgi:inositol hexakisphosphate/diphosphoinositol-pentakisphosphate kinase